MLAVDPRLGARLGSGDFEVARRRLRAAVLELPAGPWPAASGTLRDGLGLLVLDGLLVRDAVLADRTNAELLGRGDLLRPWDDDRASAPVAALESRWTVLRPARLAVLDRDFAHASGRWPDVAGVLVHRLMDRTRWLGCLRTISQLTPIDLRITVLLWHLADRWGAVSPRGVVLELPLTHDLIARLVGARRPSVSHALARLERGGAIARDGDRWLLGEASAFGVEGGFSVAAPGVRGKA